jgi:hypothetical protein
VTRGGAFRAARARSCSCLAAIRSCVVAAQGFPLKCCRFAASRTPFQRGAPRSVARSWWPACPVDQWPVFRCPPRALRIELKGNLAACRRPYKRRGRRIPTTSPSRIFGCGGPQPAELGVLLDSRLAVAPDVKLTPPATRASSECQDTSAPARSRQPLARSACCAPAPTARAFWGSRNLEREHLTRHFERFARLADHICIDGRDRDRLHPRRLQGDSTFTVRPHRLSARYQFIEEAPLLRSHGAMLSCCHGSLPSRWVTRSSVSSTTQSIRKVRMIV